MPKLEYVCPECNETFLGPSALEGRSSPCPLCNEKIDRWPAPRPKTAPSETQPKQKAVPSPTPKSNEKFDLGKSLFGDRIEDDENEDDALPPGPRGRASGFDLISVLSIVGIVAWGLLFLSILGGGLSFIVLLSNAQSAPQEAAAGAIFSTIFIGLYIIVRCIEKLIVGIERIQTNRNADKS